MSWSLDLAASDLDEATGKVAVNTLAIHCSDAAAEVEADIIDQSQDVDLLVVGVLGAGAPAAAPAPMWHAVWLLTQPVAHPLRAQTRRSLKRQGRPHLVFDL